MNIKQLNQALAHKDDRINELEHYIQSLHQRVEITQEELEEINRKNQGLN